MKNKNKGITLIALIITIVVLIILAGVALNIALGENGIFTKSKLSADTYVNAAANEVEELQKAESIIDELIESKTDPYNGQATADEVVPQLFMYEIINPATASNEEGVDGITKLADTSEELKIAATNTKPTAKIVGINYDTAFGSLAEYTAYNDIAGSGYENTDTEASHTKFENIVKNNYSKLVIPAKVTLNASGEYDANGTEYTVVEVGSLGDIEFESNQTSHGDSTLVPYFTKNVSEIVIPNTIIRFSDYTNAGEGAFSWYSMLTSLKIPSSVTSIGDRAFFGCSSLTSVTIPNSVTSIGDDAFYECSNLTSITIPSSVTSIGDDAFGSCSSLTSVTILCNLTNLYLSGVFDDAPVENYTFGVGEIPTSILEYNSDVKNVVLLDGVTSIGDSAFNNCSNLTSVTIPNSVTSIGNEAFNNCSNLISVTIPNRVTSIGDNAFNSCSSLTSMIIPNSVTSIGDYAFEYCSNLTSITIPNSVTSIGESAFEGCSSLASVTIPNSVTSIGSSAFNYLPSGSTIYVQSQDVANLLVDYTNYESSNTTVVVDPSKF